MGFAENKRPRGGGDKIKRYSAAARRDHYARDQRDAAGSNGGRQHQIEDGRGEQRRGSRGEKGRRGDAGDHYRG